MVTSIIVYIIFEITPKSGIRTLLTKYSSYIIYIRYLSEQITIIISSRTFILMFKNNFLFDNINVSLYYLHTVLQVLENNNINRKKNIIQNFLLLSICNKNIRTKAPSSIKIIILKIETNQRYLNRKNYILTNP